MATQTVTELHALEPTISLPSIQRSHDAPIPNSSPSASPEILLATPDVPPLPRLRAIIVIAQLSALLSLSSFSNGITVIALPAMQSALSLPESLLVWPTSAYYLTAGSCLLLSGSLADVLGMKRVNLFGTLLGSAFALACGLSQSAGGMIAFRALQGVANAIVTPSAVAIVSHAVAEGRPRNMGFACMGFSQPLGFLFGLVLGGVLNDSVGWRPGFYIAAAGGLAVFLLGLWSLPADGWWEGRWRVWERIKGEVDWVGVVLASTGLAMLSYVLALISADIDAISKASSIVLLTITGISILSFVGWMHWQVKNSRVALIPNSLWKSHIFTSSCIMVLLTTAITNCMELYSSLFFQQIQGTSATGASLQVLPSLVAGVLTNILAGIFVNRMPVLWTVLLSCLMSTAAPLLMALIRTDQPYWENAFFAQILTPISCDLLFTVGLLIISDVFPKHTQALGGAVFNTCAQLGTAIGLSVTQVVASSVTKASLDKSPSGALMEGYRVAFWVMFGWMVVVCVVCMGGLRRVGGIGLKRD